MSVSRQLVKELISDLPLATVSYAFAYGSGAVSQMGENMADKMVDIIVCTRDPQAFHEENRRLNSSHYSCVSRLGTNTLVKLQDTAARMYYNTNVRTKAGRLIKYGIISEEALKDDLFDWRWLYAAGRLHKPVVNVISPPAEYEEWIKQNRLYALQAALLVLPDTFSFPALFESIVRLSYAGDFRMLIGEDRAKIYKIASGNAEQLEATYLPLLKEDTRVSIANGTVLQDASTTAIYHRLNQLPSEVVNRLLRKWNRQHKSMVDAEEMLFALARRHDVTVHLEGVFSSIVRDSSLTQSMKNALTAGLAKSTVYSTAKLTKWITSMRAEKRKRREEESKLNEKKEGE